MRYEDFKVGYQKSFTRIITEELNREFGYLIYDFNPVHFDEERMKKTVYGGRITNGLLTASTIAVALVDIFATEDSLPIAIKKEIEFTAPVFIGDTITGTVTIQEKYPEKKRILCDCIVKKQDGTVVMKEKFLIKVMEA
jgi:3-hydroxybutyryl-CoA dehydratase